ncbi:inorganic pyrophosphatase [Calocera cornea HHB12733]|uniref:Inorganic pyrophosphatase n=1 Tax=Calocera cornea HHB12733 TaxID=1353952 RepID=A0A165E515_9BASI|nr:inorganic pyrophosphatase [Calocera cornea HHB12733]
MYACCVFQECVGMRETDIGGTRLMSTAVARNASNTCIHSLFTTIRRSMSAGYRPRQIGPLNTLEHRVYLDRDGTVVSPFHDVPLFVDQQNYTLNMVVEIPRWTNAKLEISKEEPLNPIKQDTKKGRPRFVRNVFPYKGYIWNYGAFPQTWEDPNKTESDTNAKGDCNPLDVIEIGEEVGHTGQIKQVKVLGIIALIDEGETDWKAVVIDVRDPDAGKLNDIDDVEKFFPGLLRATNEWFRLYKLPEGKSENVFAFSGEAKNRNYAINVINECHEAWCRLIKGETAAKTETYNISIKNSTIQSSSQLDRTYDGVPTESVLSPARIDSAIDKSFHIGFATI